VPSASPGTTDAPTPDEVERIAEIPDPVLRNLAITACYSRLAAAMAARGDPCSNWCTFATWASRQAGRTIRGEDLLAGLEHELGRDAELLHPIDALWRALVRRGLFRRDSRLGRLVGDLHTPFDAFELASDAVARGNRKVFAEIGLEFSRYLRDCDPDLPPDAPAFAAFLDGLRPGEPPDGQRFLRQAFARYQQQRLEPDPGLRAELVVLANLEIGLHEQTRLQPEIRAGLDAPFVTQEQLGLRVLEAAFPSAARLWPAVRRPAAAVVGALAKLVQRASTRIAREAITASFMTLALPGRTLALGRHLEDEYPENLREPADPELAELLARYEPIPPAPDDCGARDWSELAQRMHYISHLFRAFHESEALADPPFTAEQLASLGRGVVPAGDL
jgi:hypothetical protein